MTNTQEESNENWPASKSLLKFWDRAIIIIIAIIFILVVLRIVLGSMFSVTSRTMSFLISDEALEPAYEEEAPEAAYEMETAFEPEPSETAHESPEPEYGEVTDKTIDTSNKKLGEVEISIPRLIRPKSSNVISLSIYRPSKLASADPTSFLIVEIENDTLSTIPTAHGELFSDSRTILVDEQMKAEIVAPAFEVEDLLPEIQAVEVETIGQPTRWAWSVIAPEAEGVHVINFKVYVDEEDDAPSWFGAYQIEVMAPTPLPSDTPTPSPVTTNPQESDMARVIDSTKFLLDLLAIISTIIGGVFAIIRPFIKRRVDLTGILK